MPPQKSARGRILAKKLRKALDTNVSLDQSSFLAELMQAFDGPTVLSKKIRELYENTQSPMVQQKIMSMIVTLVTSTTQRELAQEFDPSELSDDELDRIASSYFEKVQTHVKTDESDGDAGQAGGAGGAGQANEPGAEAKDEPAENKGQDPG